LAVWTTPAHLAAPPVGTTWNTQIVENLIWAYEGKLLYLPTPSEDLTASGKVHGIRDGAYCVPVINRDAGTLTQMAYRSDTANSKIDMGIYLDDGNGTTCSKISTTGLTVMAGGAGAKMVPLALPAPVTPFTKYWLVIGFAITKSGSGGKLGTILGTDGPMLSLCKRALNVMPLPTVITFDTSTKARDQPTASPCLAAFPA
jgi:hypothetical protein